MKDKDFIIWMFEKGFNMLNFHHGIYFYTAEYGNDNYTLEEVYKLYETQK